MKLTNNANRALGVPGARRSLVVQPKQSIQIDAADLEALQKNRTSNRWLKSGILSVDDAPLKEEKKKEEKKDEDTEVEVRHVGGGWYEVYVSGIDVSQGKLRRDEAEKLAAQYLDEGEE